MTAEMCATNFALICENAQESGFSEISLEGGIGTYKERVQHAVLKRFFESDFSCHEVKVCGYIADICSGKSIIEIQTSDFYRMRGKLRAYIKGGFDVTVVYPVPAKKWIFWVDTETGSISKRRKSPKNGGVFEIIPELYSIREIIKDGGISFYIMLLEVEDYRLLCGYANNKKKGSRRFERIPLSLLGSVKIKEFEDYRIFLPEGLPNRFFAREFAKLAKVRSATAYKALSILTIAGIIKKREKQGRAFIYEIL